MTLLEMLVFHTMPPLWCCKCGRFRPYDEFYRNPHGGKQYMCKRCWNRRPRKREP